MWKIPVFVLCLCLFGLLFAAFPAQAEACPDAPLPRLQAGDTAQVMPGLRGLRLRALPAVGAGTLLNLNGGTTFTVLSGPSCNGGYNWWRVELTGQRRGWLAEGTWFQYFLKPITEQTVCDALPSPLLYAMLWRVCGL